MEEAMLRCSCCKKPMPRQVLTLFACIDSTQVMLEIVCPFCRSQVIENNPRYKKVHLPDETKTWMEGIR